MTIATQNGHPDNLPARIPAAAAPAEQDSALMLFSRDLLEAANIAESLARTSFVPATLRGKVADLTAAILAGQELGLPLMATLRSIDIIQGTPGLRAHAMRGLVQSHGHTVQLVDSTPDRCVMRGLRKGEEQWQTVEWTIERAALMQLTNKPEWKKQPGTMLVARATGEICRLIASDVLYAMPYAAEELDGMSSAPPADDAPVTAAEILSSRRPNTPADSTGAPAPAPAPAVEPSERMITQPQLKMMGALMRKHGLTDRDTALAFVVEVIGRPVDSRNELTRAEAGRVIDKLESEKPPAPAANEPVDAEVVDTPEAQQLIQQIIAAWQGTTGALEQVFQQALGVASDKATEAQLQTFLDQLKAGKHQAAVNDTEPSF